MTDSGTPEARSGASSGAELGKEQRKRLKRTDAALSRAEAKTRAEHRNDPLPQGVWIVECNGTFQSLTVLEPGRISLRCEGEPRQLDVTSVKVPVLCRSKLILIDDTKTCTRITALKFGEAGALDVGRPASGSVSGGQVSDAGDVAFLFLSAVCRVIFSPLVALAHQGRWRAARQIRQAIER